MKLKFCQNLVRDKLQHKISIKMKEPINAFLWYSLKYKISIKMKII